MLSQNQSGSRTWSPETSANPRTGTIIFKLSSTYFCGEYKLIINQVAQTDTYPLPKSKTCLHLCQEVNPLPNSTLLMPTNKFHWTKKQKNIPQSTHTRVFTVAIACHLELRLHPKNFQLTILGHRVSAQGLQPTDAKVQAICNAPPPRNIRNSM